MLSPSLKGRAAELWARGALSFCATAMIRGLSVRGGEEPLAVCSVRGEGVRV